MTVQSWFMYLTLVIIATSTPGPAVLYITTTSALHGWKKSIFAALGNITGLLGLGIIAVTGLGTLLSASAIAFNIIKYVGAAYLIYLGLKMIVQKHEDPTTLINDPSPNCVSAQKIFFQALGVAVSNPKAIVFLTALFPQFINTENPLLPQFSMLIFTLMFFSFSFLMSYAFAAHRTKTWLGDPKRAKLFNRAGGSVFIGFGLMLAASSNK